MKWQRTPDPDLIVSPPFFIRRVKDGARYLLGRDRNRAEECLGGFESADEAKREAERING